MRHRLAAPAVAVLLAVLVGCGGGSDEPKAKPEPAPTSEPAVDCDDPELSQAEWVKHCEAAQQDEAPAEETLELGKPAETIGSGGAGALEVTPTTVVYAKQATGETPENDVFVVVSVKVRPTNAVAAAQAAPIDGGGWKWVGADGQAVDTGSGTAFNVTPDGFTAGGEIQPGTFEWASAAFDLTTTQAARGGTLMYVDGAGTAYRWAIPAQDTGPQVDELKQALQ
ncbi:hypothetical protein [Streptomyces sp. DH37]|uniref:hypothetical protein n=1 Tax=Streptomyces sp. DH37 TaxID=3040122 RepID=UPI002441AB43|nr:hypothetical protein [Streptomyces sp. DH37]MDG9701675.1 hypothetical protein [Streptomyces sp. DH37]